MPEKSIWDEVDEFLETHRADFNMSFGLEYSSIVDWVADFTPRRNHPQARDYGLWQGSGVTREDAIRQALEAARAGIRAHQEGLASAVTPPASR